MASISEPLHPKQPHVFFLSPPPQKAFFLILVCWHCHTGLRKELKGAEGCINLWALNRVYYWLTQDNTSIFVVLFIPLEMAGSSTSQECMFSAVTVHARAVQLFPTWSLRQFWVWPSTPLSRRILKMIPEEQQALLRSLTSTSQDSWHLPGSSLPSRQAWEPGDPLPRSFALLSSRLQNLNRENVFAEACLPGEFPKSQDRKTKAK